MKMKEKIAKVLDKILKRKFYTLHDVHYDKETRNLSYFSDRFGGYYGSKEAAEKELLDRGYIKVNVDVETHGGSPVNPYRKTLWRKTDHCEGYFYANITEESFEW